MLSSIDTQQQQDAVRAVRRALGGVWFTGRGLVHCEGSGARCLVHPKQRCLLRGVS